MAKENLSSCDSRIEKMQEAIRKLENKRKEKAQSITVKIFGNIIDNKNNSELVLLLETYGNDKNFTKHIENSILKILQDLKEKVETGELSFKDYSKRRKKSKVNEEKMEEN
ncbi:hypothetical protein [uncultured Fusobacterium sp.]|uniref:hypothetical protein n=1 Tax=uncultured Fusobacterium sp. TaxID=159267 RepID=UPI0015A635B0|nr:hypothetical protein [uncultured Fusobacterium sp.]